MNAVFSELRVLDLTRVVAGPMATQMLADMGATVYKIERPGEGDDTRRMGPFVTMGAQGERRESAAYHAYNRGKQSITLDLAQPEGAALARELALRCDVVVDNYKAGALQKYGLDAASLRAAKPELICCSITGFGQDGPYAERPAYDFITQGLAGLMSTCGHANGEPMRTSVPITDVVTGLYAGVAIVSALYHRQHTGQGQFIDAALIDASVALNGHLAQGFLMGAPVPHRAGNSNPIAAPSEVFDCSDGPLIVAAGNNTQFRALCALVGLPGLADDARFQTNAQRIAHRDELRQALATPLARMSRADLSAALARHGVPGGPINTVAEVFEDPQVRHRELVQHVRMPDGSTCPVLRSPLRFSQTPVQHSASPALGEHSAAVLQRELGLSPEHIERLRAQSIV
jgi:crotonobetainyl-CoA:carnitine CoA-transferase CaiB-like acyl-CoA transferase